MAGKRIVLDTNCLISSLSRRGQYYPVWKGLQTGEITDGHDDDKFVDCAFAANATYIVSNDKHYDVLKEIDFPKILVLKLQEFLGLLQSEKDNKV